MGQNLFDLSVWAEPFGLFKSELRSESKLQTEDPLSDIVVYAIIIAIDLLTLPLAILLFFGIDRDEDLSEKNIRELMTQTGED